MGLVNNQAPFLWCSMKNFSTAFVFLLSVISSVQADFINFELWNKHTQTTYYALGSSLDDVVRQPIQALAAGKWISRTLNTALPTFLLISMERVKKGSSVDVYEFKPFKDMYVRVALLPERTITRFLKMILGIRYFEGSNYIFGPQTGPLLGARRVTERGHDLGNNNTYEDITRHTSIYSGPVHLSQ